MLKRPPTDTQFIVITLVLVLLMGIPTFKTLTAYEPDVVSDHVAASATNLASQQRAPSSVPAQTVLKPSRPALSHLTRYDVSCAKKAAAAFVVSGNYVQLQGKNCLKNFKDGDIEIINKSNGYTASVFPSGTDKYQTDLIQLQNGDNEIAIRYRERSGKAVEEVLRIRSPQI